jgi:hypothetical protein
MDPDAGGPKTYGPYGFGSAILVYGIAFSVKRI